MDEKKTPRSQYAWKPPIDKLDKVEALIAESGKSANAFFTQCILGRRSSFPLPLKLAAGQGIHWLGVLADHSRGLLKTAKSHPSSPMLDKILDTFERIERLLIEIRSALFLILGRKP